MSTELAAAGVEEVRSPWDDRLLAELPISPADAVDAAVAAAARAAREPLAPYARYEILARAAELVAERAEDFARTIVAEAGKPIRDARAETARAVQTLRLCAEEAKRIVGEGVPLDAAPRSADRLGLTLRVPVGPVCAISPFNQPLNGVAHKVPVALAAGCSVVLKPSEVAPLSAIALLETLAEAGLPRGYANLVLGPGVSVGEQLLADSRFAAYTFTGSVAVGKRIRRTVGLRKTLLELGNSGATIVHRDADLGRAAAASARAAFAYAGQQCTSTQRLVVHEQVLDEFMERFLAEVATLAVGDPSEEGTDVGPMIDAASAVRAERSVEGAVAEGARLAVGGERDGTLLAPTVLLDVGPEMRIAREEVFAPVVGVMAYRELDAACELVNATRYGLQSAVFTASLDVAFGLARRLEVGGLIVNDASTMRLDQMPFGGVKDSGVGREGVRYAVEEMTEPRLLALNFEQAE